MRDEPPITYETQFKDAPLGKRIGYAGLMNVLPLAVGVGAIMISPEGYEGVLQQIATYITQLD